MVRFAGEQLMTLDAVGAILERNRRGTRDVYAALDGARVDIRDPLAPLPQRYAVTLPDMSRALGLTETSARQLSSLAGVPVQFLERLPASMGLGLLRSCLQMELETRENPQFLVRLREGATPRVRAILPASYVRFDDREVFQGILDSVVRRNIRVTDLTVTEDVFSIRIIYPDRLNLGSQRNEDPGHVGIGIRNSETGRPLEIRRFLWRQVCSNGMTALTDVQERLRRRKIGLNRQDFRELVLDALDESVRWGRESTRRLGDGHAEFIREPAEEVRRIFREYRLGDPKAVPARLVLDEAARSAGLLGVSRFDLVQSFTAVARRLDLDTRHKWEDAMGTYLYGEAERN